MSFQKATTFFGCTGFNRKTSFCILNKQYSQAEYEDLLPRIIAHMKSTGEYGLFFPMKFSDFPYVDSIAQEFFPITNTEQAKQLDIPWSAQKSYPTAQNIFPLPDDIAEMSESLCEHVIADKETARAFKLQKKELAFYQAHRIPLPEYCFETRNLKRSTSLINLPQP